jgi:hypothetical protein
MLETRAVDHIPKSFSMKPTLYLGMFKGSVCHRVELL